jgi:hypothetical protein
MNDKEKKVGELWINPAEEAEVLRRCERARGIDLGVAKKDFSRFGFMAIWLSGDLPEHAYHSKSLAAFRPERFKHLFDKLKSGAHVVSFGASNGDESLGMLAVLEDKFGLTDTHFLVTDFSDYARDWPDVTDKLGKGFLEGSRVFYIDRPDDYYNQVSEKYLTKKSWRGFRSRINREYGDDWDATSDQVFDRAREKVGGEIGLMVLRHPEIGDEHNPELSEVFKSVISNLFDEAMSSETPVLITTSNNKLSRKRIKEAIQKKISEVSDFEDNWDFYFGATPHLVQRDLYGREMDSYFFTLIPKNLAEEKEPELIGD